MTRTWLVTQDSNKHVIVHLAGDREDAKRYAHDWLGGNADDYTVTPLTNHGDLVHFNITAWA